MKRRAQPWLGTLVEITIADALGEDQLLTCFNEAFGKIADVHRLMSFHDAASDVSRINQAPVGESIALHAATYEVLRIALSVAAASGGMFDIGCAPKLIESGHLPMLAGDAPGFFPGHCALMLEHAHRIKKTEPVWIDLGGIAKGYAVDMAIGVLQQSGLRSACVNAGGDLRVFGDIAYPVAIRDPGNPGAAGLQIQLQDEALATSGTYFSRKRMHDGESSALINGKDGQAVIGNFSASVRAPTCVMADALTKVVMASADPHHPVLQQFGATAFIM
jgi:thiamine biosynthesis lipoprotein